MSDGMYACARVCACVRLEVVARSLEVDALFIDMSYKVILSTINSQLLSNFLLDDFFGHG